MKMGCAREIVSCAYEDDYDPGFSLDYFFSLHELIPSQAQGLAVAHGYFPLRFFSTRIAQIHANYVLLETRYLEID